MTSLQFGKFTLDRRRRELRRGTEVLAIPGKAFDLLAYMAANPGRPLSKSELLDAVWPEIAVEESNLSQNVFLLRKVLGGGDGGPIKTLARHGYQFAVEVVEIDEAPKPVETSAPEVGEPRPVVPQEQARQSIGLPRWVWLTGISAAIGVLAAFGWIAWQRWLDRSGGAPVQVVLAAMEGSTGDAVLDRSLVQAMRMDLAQSPYVTVLSTASTAERLSEMHRKPEELSDPAISREVCERSNSQAVLSGNVARAGQHYLVTEEASSCVDGSVIGQAKYEADKAEDLPHAVDTLAANLRQKLGESRRSIARFNTPLFEHSTASLEALKALTQGLEEERKGDAARSIALLKLAIVADPGFPWAYYSLATADSNAGDYAGSREAAAKAYSLREAAGRQESFAITALYHALSTEDLYESLRNYQEWAQLYPNSGTAWNGLAWVQANLGRHEEAVESDRRALALGPDNQNFMDELANGLIAAGRPAEAKQVLDQAIAKHFSDNFIRVRYLELAYLLHDEAMLRAQRQWSAEHPNTPIELVGECDIAVAEGRFADARKLIERLSQIYREQGVPGAADQYAKTEALAMMEAGDLSDGKRIFSSSPADLDEGEQVYELAYSGNYSAAEAAIHAAQSRFPNGTFWNLYYRPLTEAIIALDHNKAAEAAAVLERTRPVQWHDLRAPWLRGKAYLAAGQPVLAEKDFRSVVTQPNVDPTSASIALSWLGLGRALAAQGKKAEATEAYKHFLMLWAHADSDALYLTQAKQELASLQ